MTNSNEKYFTEIAFLHKNHNMLDSKPVKDFCDIVGVTPSKITIRPSKNISVVEFPIEIKLTEDLMYAAGITGLVPVKIIDEITVEEITL